MASATLKPTCFQLRPPTLFATRVLPPDEVLSPGKELDSTFFADSVVLLVAVELPLTGGCGPALLRSYWLRISESAPLPLEVLGSFLGYPSLIMTSILVRQRVSQQGICSHIESEVYWIEVLREQTIYVRDSR